MNQKNMNRYREIRGVLKQKYRNVFGKYVWVIGNCDEQVSVIVGKGLYEMYMVSDDLTVGYIGKKIINVRPGIVDNID